ncbi:MAG: 30S ribosomal protein S7 [Candidatus Omnitrophota bacterium]|nr:MAG: 30S ribosomal protein S7 [Candidatus Omnitrophota bacterium]
MRRRRAEKRKISPDPLYHSYLVQKMINMIMWDGKKSVAEKIVYDAFEIIMRKLNKQTPQEVLEVVKKAIDNVKPAVEVRPRRVGGATFQVPVEVPPDRALSLALRWIRESARGKKGKPMSERLAQELLDAYKGEGAAVKKKIDTHKMAEANRAFAHYRW